MCVAGPFKGEGVGSHDGGNLRTWDLGDYEEGWVLFCREELARIYHNR